MIEKLLEKIVTWANAEDAIRVMIIEGSRARRDHTVDRFSDYDLNLYVTDVTHYTGNDAWIVGKHMQSWVEAEIWQTLGGIFARFDKEDSWRAVCALMPLYHRLAGETARQLNYRYPQAMDKAISEFILTASPLDH